MFTCLLNAENPDPYISPDPRRAALEEKVKATREFVLTWSKAKEGFSEKALRSTMHSYCTAATIAIHRMLDAGKSSLFLVAMVVEFIS